jgi:AraC-like DNA-binding protein
VPDRVKSEHKTKISQSFLSDMLNVLHKTHHHTLAKSSTEVMEGLLAFSRLESGISVHCSDAIEMQDMSSSIELPPCLSFNLVFKGKVDFNLGGQTLFLGKTSLTEIECSAIVLNKPELMTRFLKQGEHVIKVNVFIEQTWLKARCKNKKDFEIFERVFSDHLALHKWAACDTLIKLAQQILQAKTKNGLAAELLVEHSAMQILCECINTLSVKVEKLYHSKIQSKACQIKQVKSLKIQIDSLLEKPLSLTDIALSLGLSISTLQRRFKQEYGTTVVDYIKQKRLENARSAIVFDGLSIGEAAYKAGYNHSSNFITAFKKRFDITPASLAKTHFINN